MMRKALLAGLVAFMLAGMSDVAVAVNPPVLFTFEPTTGVAQSSGNPDFPWMLEYALTIIDIPEDITYIDDLEVDAPTIIPGYVEVHAPSNWEADVLIVGRAGFWANPNYEYDVEGVYLGFRIEWKQPYIEPGTATVTKNTVVVGGPVNTQVLSPEPATLALLGVGLAGLLARRKK